jgi:uncharacterized protein YxjI
MARIIGFHGRVKAMRYIMKQQTYSATKWQWVDNFVIKNEQNLEVYRVGGIFEGLAHQLSFMDMAGNELVSIKQKPFAWGATFNIYRKDGLYAVVHKQVFSLDLSLTIEVQGEGILKTEGLVSSHEYSFLRQGKPIASVSKEWKTIANTYGIEVEEGIDPVLILSSAIVIDEIMRDSGE